MKAFVQNEAGSRIKHSHNEKTLELIGMSHVSWDYPNPSGFFRDMLSLGLNFGGALILRSARGPQPLRLFILIVAPDPELSATIFIPALWGQIKIVVGCIHQVDATSMS